jgi:hypothetical protein
MTGDGAMPRPPKTRGETMSMQSEAAGGTTVRLQRNSRRLLAILGLASLIPAGLSAQSSETNDLSVALRFGTLGIGGEISKLVTPHIGLRASGNYFSYNRTFNNDNNAYNANLKFEAFTGLLDLYPGGRGAFHFSAGVMTRPISLSATGVPNGTFQINQHTYTSAQVGTLTETLQWGSALPYVGLGFGTPAAKNSGLSLLIDAGVAIGKPTVSLTASNANSGSQLATDLQAQIKKQQNDANNIPVYPVLSLGIAYRF